MPKLIRPHVALEVITPDEVAECWDGVLDAGMYDPLWAVVRDYEKIDREDCGPFDVVGVNSVASFWRKFTKEQRIKLNELAERNER